MTHLIALLVALLASWQDPSGRPVSDGATFTADHVLIISIDGLRSDALLATLPGTLPAFERLRSGSSTLNARTNVESTFTMPNHVSMVTGRLMSGDGGHGWSLNDLDRDHPIIVEPDGTALPSVFDVAQQAGVATRAVVSKRKFLQFATTWTSLDEFVNVIDDAADPRDGTAKVADETIRLLGRPDARSLFVVHFAEPDYAGHADGWDLTRGSSYLRSIAAVDRALGRIFEVIDGDARLRGRTAIVLTADHGGGAPHRSHTHPDMWVNYIIPFMVWAGDTSSPLDLYELNASTRAEPGLRRPDATAAHPPIRNGDAANAAMSLLGLDDVPKSTMKHLRLRAK